MPVTPEPNDLESINVVLGPQGEATVKTVTPNLYAELDQEFDGFAGHRLVSQHTFEAPWGIWELHPRGDEIIYLLSGDIDFVLWVEGQETILRVDQPGSYIVVPRGIWHTARPRMRTSMLFITPGEETQHAESPPHD